MNIRTSLISVALLIFAGSAIADDLADFKKFYAKMLPQTVESFKRRDLGHFERMATADFVYKDHQGKKQTRKQSLAGMKQMFAAAERIEPKFSPKGYSFKNGKAVVESTSQYKITLRPGQDKKVHVLEMGTAERETWIRSGGTWKLTMIEETKAPTMKIDGKALEQGSHG